MDKVLRLIRTCVTYQYNNKNMYYFLEVSSYACSHVATYCSVIWDFDCIMCRITKENATITFSWLGSTICIQKLKWTISVARHYMCTQSRYLTCAILHNLLDKNKKNSLRFKIASPMAPSYWLFFRNIFLQPYLGYMCYRYNVYNSYFVITNI